MASIDESYIYDYFDDIYISTNDIEDIWGENYVHTDINVGDSRLKIRDRIMWAQSECKQEELSENRMVNGLHRFFKAVVNKLNNSFTNLGELGLEVSCFIP